MKACALLSKKGWKKMLSPNLVNALDMAAANGILDCDGAAFITGTQPRYMGSPQFALPQANLQQPLKDEMIYKNPTNKQSANPLWKQVLFGALVVGLGIFGLAKLKNIPSVKDGFNKIKTFDTSKIKNSWNSFCQFFKDGFEKIFRKKSPPAP